MTLASQSAIIILKIRRRKRIESSKTVLHQRVKLVNVQRAGHHGRRSSSCEGIVIRSLFGGASGRADTPGLRPRSPHPMRAPTGQSHGWPTSYELFLILRRATSERKNNVTYLASLLLALSASAVVILVQPLVIYRLIKSQKNDKTSTTLCCQPLSQPY